MRQHQRLQLGAIWTGLILKAKLRVLNLRGAILTRPTGRKRLEDLSFSSDEQDADYSNHQLIRCSAKGRSFERVNFSYTNFDACYFRNCKFVSCSFTGCRFLAVNLRGSTFASCHFEYASFEKTLIANDILDRECPELENLKAEFARSLRINYQQLGDAESVNKAIRVELDATKAHLRNAWSSGKTYYRQKYRGFRRFRYFLKWSSFRVLDIAWGNGESAFNLLGTIVAILVLMTLYQAICTGDTTRISSYVGAFQSAPSVFFGVGTHAELARWYLTLITAIRLVVFAGFISILTKRLSRR